jgi:Putative prokaryotic signal transducing protein
MNKHDDPELELVFQSIDPIQVQIARDMLEGAGISSFIFDGETSRMLGTTVAIEARLMVPAAAAADARARLKELGFDPAE